MDKRYKVINAAISIILFASLSLGQENYSILDVKLGDSLNSGKSKIASEFKNMICNDYNIDTRGLVSNLGVYCVNEKDKLQTQIDRLENVVAFGTNNSKNIISIKRKISFAYDKYASFESIDNELIKKYGKPQFEYSFKHPTGRIGGKSYLWRADKNDILPSSDGEAKKINNKFRDYANRNSLPSTSGYITNKLDRLYYNNSTKNQENDEIIGEFLYCHITPPIENDKLVRHIECVLTDQNEVIQSNNYYVNTIIDKINASSNKEVEQSKFIKTKF